jgi:hypothetical protein
MPDGCLQPLGERFPHRSIATLADSTFNAPTRDVVPGWDSNFSAISTFGEALVRPSPARSGGRATGGLTAASRAAAESNNHFIDVPAQGRPALGTSAEIAPVSTELRPKVSRRGAPSRNNNQP